MCASVCVGVCKANTHFPSTGCSFYTLALRLAAETSGPERPNSEYIS